MKCYHCDGRKFTPSIRMGTWREGPVVRRRALGVWTCVCCGYGGTAFQSDLTAKAMFLLFNIHRLQWAIRQVRWCEDRPA